MQITLIPGEPLATAIARFAADRHRHVGAELRRMVPSRATANLGFALPLHLRRLAAELPSTMALAPETLVENFTGFPAIAPLLETHERAQLVDFMVAGNRVGHFPICHGREMHSVKQRIRFCPVCAHHDRRTLGFAAFRVRHNLHGVVACADHACSLVEVDCGFGDSPVPLDADLLIGESLPDVAPGSGCETQIARDLAALFVPTCPRPGRRKVAAFLRRALVEHGYGNGGQVDDRLVVLALEREYTDVLRSIFDPAVPQKLSSWRCCYAAEPRLYPIVKLALLARLVNTTVAGVLEAALHLGDGDERRSRAGAPKSKRQPSFPRIRRDWAALDVSLEEKVRWVARVHRVSQAYPQRISAYRLARTVDATRWRRRNLWQDTLPGFHAALAAEADSDLSFASRVLDWTMRETAGGRLRRANTFGSFVCRAGIAKLAKKNPTVADAAKRAFLAQRPYDGTHAQLNLFDHGAGELAA